MMWLLSSLILSLFSTLKLTQLIKVPEWYRVTTRERLPWLIGRLARRAQSALLNSSATQRGDWAALASALHSYSHGVCEVRMAELLTLNARQ